jgi:hypothetical protein
VDGYATEILIDSIFATSKDKLGQNSFSPGDVKILMKTPWYEQKSNTQIGTKIVFEIHIYNTYAMRFDDYSSRTQEVGRDSIPRDKSGGGYLAECESSDISDLTKKAHLVCSMLTRDKFVENFVQTLRLDNRLRSTAFSDLLDIPTFVDQSAMLSSWIIKTEVGGGSVYDHEMESFLYSEYTTRKFNVTNRSFGEYIPYFLIPILCYMTYFFRRQKHLTGYNIYLPIVRKKDKNHTKDTDDFDSFGNQSHDIEIPSHTIYKTKAKCTKRFT